MLVLGVIWIGNMGFCGADMDTYLPMFGNYNFQNPFFYKKAEFSVGIIASLIKVFDPSLQPKEVATYYRLLIFVLVPAGLIISSPTSRCALVRFCSLISFVAITPFAFLSSANMINNGLSITLFYYLLLFGITRRVFSMSKKPKLFSGFFEFLLIFFAAFAHPFGLGLVILSLLVFLLFYFLKAFRLLDYFSDSQTLPLGYLLVLAFPALFLSSIAANRLTSQLPDGSVFYSSLALFVSVFVLWLSSKSFIMCFSSADEFNDSGMSFLIPLIWLLSFLSFFSVGLGFLSGTDSAERFVGCFLAYNTLLSLLFLQLCGFKRTSSRPEFYMFSNRRQFYYLSVVYFFMLSQNFYFFYSNAFYANTSLNGICL